jgi:hypothetical protein
MNMSRVLYTAMLFVMTVTGFGEFSGSLSDQINSAKDKTIEANGASKQAELAWDWKQRFTPKPVRTPSAVAGVRG